MSAAQSFWFVQSIWQAASTQVPPAAGQTASHSTGPPPPCPSPPPPVDAVVDPMLELELTVSPLVVVAGLVVVLAAGPLVVEDAGDPPAPAPPAPPPSPIASTKQAPESSQKHATPTYAHRGPITERAYRGCPETAR